MLTANSYLLFRNKIDPILRDCTIPAEARDRIPQNDLAHYLGESTFTRGKVFFFRVSRAKAHQKDLLLICRGLPKMDAVLPGTACTISSLALTRRVPNKSLLKPQFEASEQFFALLTLADIASYQVLTSKSGITYLNANISLDYKDIVVP